MRLASLLVVGGLLVRAAPIVQEPNPRFPAGMHVPETLDEVDRVEAMADELEGALLRHGEEAEERIVSVETFLVDRLVTMQTEFALELARLEGDLRERAEEALESASQMRQLRFRLDGERRDESDGPMMQHDRWIHAEDGSSDVLPRLPRDVRVNLLVLLLIPVAFAGACVGCMRSRSKG